MTALPQLALRNNNNKPLNRKREPPVRLWVARRDAKTTLALLV